MQAFGDGKPNSGGCEEEDCILGGGKDNKKYYKKHANVNPNQKHIAKLVITICNTQVSLSAPTIKRKKLSKLSNLWKGLKHLL